MAASASLFHSSKLKRTTDDKGEIFEQRLCSYGKSARKTTKRTVLRFKDLKPVFSWVVMMHTFSPSPPEAATGGSL